MLQMVPVIRSAGVCTGVGSTTLPLKIYSMVRLGVSPKINALSALIVFFSVLLIVLADRFQHVRTVLSSGEGEADPGYKER